VGILHFFARTEEERRININSVGPFWDGNEVWLIAGGGALFAAFSPVYAAVWSGFYLALILLLVALTARAIAFDYRAKVESERWKKFFDFCFAGGSLVIALLLGVAFGNILHGVPIDERGEFTGTFFTLLNPYALMVGILTVVLFTLHGALWMAVKAEGDHQRRMIGTAQAYWIAFASLYIVSSFISFFAVPHLFTGMTGKALWWVFLILLMGAMVLIPIFLGRKRPFLAFLSSSVMMAGMIGTAAVGFFPVLVPSTLDPAYSLSAFRHSSSAYTLEVMFWIALCGMPLALLYKAIIYRTFRGKTVLTKESY
jgi:cytochrome d ubiquinol oxidase subunit II